LWGTAAALEGLEETGSTLVLANPKKKYGEQVVAEALADILVLAVLELIAVTGLLAPVAVQAAAVAVGLDSIPQAVEQ
jgi:hypothetical protein